MNLKYIIGSALAAGLLVGCASEKAESQAKQVQLRPAVKVSQADAEKIALAKVPNGTVKEAKLEKEHGKLIWSLEVATPGTKDITEVNVDALTGDVVSLEQEPAGKDKD